MSRREGLSKIRHSAELLIGFFKFDWIDEIMIPTYVAHNLHKNIDVHTLGESCSSGVVGRVSGAFQLTEIFPSSK